MKFARLSFENSKFARLNFENFEIRQLESYFNFKKSLSAMLNQYPELKKFAMLNFFSWKFNLAEFFFFLLENSPGWIFIIKNSFYVDCRNFVPHFEIIQHFHHFYLNLFELWESPNKFSTPKNFNFNKNKLNSTKVVEIYLFLACERPRAWSRVISFKNELHLIFFK